MMHRTWLLILSLLVIFPTAGLARIGETLQECVRRYGQPIDPEAKGPIFCFRKGEFEVAVHLFDNKVCAIFYRKAEKKFNKPVSLSDDDVDALMQFNGGNRKWKRIINISTSHRWITEDGALIGEHDVWENNFCVFTKEHADRADAEEKAK